MTDTLIQSNLKQGINRRHIFWKGSNLFFFVLSEGTQTGAQGLSAVMEHLWDIHTHVLPGIDDGAEDWDMALAMLKQSRDAGVSHVIATPHFLPWKENASPQKIRELCEEAMRRCRSELGLEMQIYPGNELYYHTDILKDLAEGRASTLAGSRYVLVEFAEDVRFPELLHAAMQFQRSPYRLIAAHAERYAALRRREDLERFLETGAQMQSNVYEMQAGLFDTNKKWLKKRYAAGEIRYAASDMHNLKRRPPVTAEALAWFEKHLDAGYVQALFSDNPERIPRTEHTE